MWEQESLRQRARGRVGGQGEERTGGERTGGERRGGGRGGEEGREEEGRGEERRREEGRGEKRREGRGEERRDWEGRGEEGRGRERRGEEGRLGKSGDTRAKADYFVSKQRASNVNFPHKAMSPWGSSYPLLHCFLMLKTHVCHTGSF